MSRALALLGILLSLTGCGFAPLYGGPSSDDGAPRVGLVPAPGVVVGIIPEREGQLLRNFLIDELGHGGSGAYPLSASVSIAEQALGENDDADTTRSRVVVTSRFTLMIEGTRFPFQARSSASFSTVQSDYATLVAKNDAIRRSLRDIAKDASLRVIAILKQVSAR